MRLTPAQISIALNAERDAFRAFVLARVGNAADAEDILQNGLVRALRHGNEVDPGKATAWFYRLLRNSIIDHYRSRAADRRRQDGATTLLSALGEDVVATPGWEKQLCRCLGGVADTLPKNQGALLRLVDLEGRPVADAARELGVTSNNASVTLHRARKELRVRLQAFCGACADGACLDCDCEPAPRRRNKAKAGAMLPRVGHH